MPAIIQLPTHIANLIAAGEVVERPASVVKELLENAVDAGATKVTIEIRDGGMTFLRVTDNGCGMEPEDAKTAFLRHATSKLRRTEDLGEISTMGFRGEALAAIASVSRIDLLTKPAGAIAGTSLHLEGAGSVLQHPCPDEIYEIRFRGGQPGDGGGAAASLGAPPSGHYPAAGREEYSLHPR